MACELKELLSGLPFRPAAEFSLDIPVSGISTDTRNLNGENLFLVIGGDKFSGRDVLEELAAEKSVEYLLLDLKEAPQVPPSLRKDKNVIFVENLRENAPVIADRFYRYPQKELSLIGITGTNGKTTIAYMLFQALNALGIKASCLGTVRYWIDADTPRNAPLTTPDFLTLRKLLSAAVERKVKVAAMEVSSHALLQDRLQGLAFSRAVYTNLTQDHLDYHQTLANYFAAKARLFTEYLKESGTAVINGDDERGQVLLKELSVNRLSYGIEGSAAFRAENIIFQKKNACFTVRTPVSSAGFECKFFGKYNVYNALGAIAVLSDMGIPLKEIRRIFKTIKLPSGRMEEVCPDVYVDYAHTPDALKNSLSSLKEAGYDKIVVIFGCGGERDRSKRPLMGKFASELAEYSIITTDNPRSEDPGNICEEVRQGCAGSSSPCAVILDRREALAEGLKMVRNLSNSALLVAGKGHEDYQILSTGKISFSDQEEIRRMGNFVSR